MEERPAGTRSVTDSKVQSWAQDAIEGWMTGYAGDFSEEEFQQFRVHRLKDGNYCVESLDPSFPDPKRFRITVFVTRVV